MHDLASCFDTTAADDAFKWAAVPSLSDEDGTQLDGRGQPYWNDGCRIDERFRGAGSWAVRRLGGGELVEALLAAVRNVGADKTEYVSGILEVRGILIRIRYQPRNREYHDIGRRTGQAGRRANRGTTLVLP